MLSKKVMLNTLAVLILFISLFALGACTTDNETTMSQGDNSVEEDKITIILDEMEDAILTKDFSKAINLYEENKEPLRLRFDSEAYAMYHYAIFLNEGTIDYRTAGALAYGVDYEYEGRFDKEIKDVVISSIGMDEWESIKVLYPAYLESNPQARTITLGMTKEQVLEEGWGKPQDINRTVTQQTVKEQWVYGNGRYLYFTDGILTSFQD